MKGTDGLQFQPDLSTHDTLSVFNAEIQRTLTYKYKTSTNDYPGLTTYVFETDQCFFQNSTAQAANLVYNINIDGTTNLTTITGTPAFASKGNFYMISSLVADSIPAVLDQSGNPVVPDASIDESYFAVERFSG